MCVAHRAGVQGALQRGRRTRSLFHAVAGHFYCLLRVLQIVICKPCAVRKTIAFSVVAFISCWAPLDMTPNAGLSQAARLLLSLCAGGAGRMPPVARDPAGAPSASSLSGLLAAAAGPTSLEEKGPTTRKCCSMLRSRASRCVPRAAHRSNASARSLPMISSSSDHASSPSLRRPLHGLAYQKQKTKVSVFLNTSAGQSLCLPLCRE